MPASYTPARFPHGTKPAPLDRRDYSYHRTFGAVTPPVLPNMDYSYDAGLTMFDQIADGYMYGCTGCTQTDICIDQDKQVYDYPRTYLKTCTMEGHAPDQGCDIRTSAKALRLFGVGRTDESEEACEARRRGKSFNVDKKPGFDWFDSFRIALRNGKQSISVGTPWPQEFESPSVKGFLPLPNPGSIKAAPWHNWKIAGEATTLGNTPVLRVKSWQGKQYGDEGWVYMTREVFNAVFDVWGTLGLITPVYSPADVQTIRLEMLQQVLVNIARILALIGKKMVVYA